MNLNQMQLKPNQTQQQLDTRIENCAKKYVCISIIFINSLLIATLGILAIHTFCVYENNYKRSYIINSSSDLNWNETNDMKNMNIMNICFNNSDENSYTSLIQQLDDFYINSFCYNTNLDRFELACTERNVNGFLHNFIINSSQITEFEKYCLKNNYGYKNSNPCIILIFLSNDIYKQLNIYKFPIKLSVQSNFSKYVECKLYYKNIDEILAYYIIDITNRDDCHKQLSLYPYPYSKGHRHIFFNENIDKRKRYVAR